MTELKKRDRKSAASRREQVLDEAARLIGERGYFGFGIQELAENCGLTKAGLLHHFGSKEALLIALLRDRDERHERAVATQLSDALRDATDADEQRRTFAAAIALIVARNAAQPELVRLQVILRNEAINPSHPAHAYFTAREAAKLELLRASVASFTSDCSSTARQILALLGGLEEQWLREGGAFDLVEQSNIAVKAVLGPAQP